MRGRRHRRQRLERPRRLHRLAHRPRRHAVERGQGVVDLPTLVEHPHDRELFHPRLALQRHELVAPGAQLLRRPRPQLVEMIGDVEHAAIKP
jgi:hypothetical protein